MQNTAPPRSWNVLGEHVTCKAGRDDTGGAYSLFEVVSPPGGGPPLHIHRAEDEAFWVLEGELLVRQDGETFRAAAGAFVRFARGTPHTYRTIGTKPARFVVIVNPGGYEGFFAAMAELPTGGPPDMGRVMAIAQKYNVEIVGPPLQEPG